ncbi:hypothetical protein [Ensifer sp. LC163]|nr:hypothetical protein [Ensifer sp. LC163]
MLLQPLRTRVVLISIGRRGMIVKEAGLHGACGKQPPEWIVSYGE